MEVLRRLVGLAMEENFLFGCNIGGKRDGGLVLSHLLYADDNLTFCGADQDQLAYLTWLLM